MPVHQRLFAVTIFGYRKPGMDEDEYHQYISQTHAGHLKGLLAENKIVSYTMVGSLNSRQQFWITRVNFEKATQLYCNQIANQTDFRRSPIR
jgi:hypothetical protein